MTAYLWAAVGCGVLAVAAYPVLSYLIDKPERPRWRTQGAHHRPWWWQRHRDRRQAEQDENTKTERLFEDISLSIRRESAGRTSSGMPRTAWPLQPLPAGVEEHADHFHRPLPPEVKGADPTTMCRDCANGYCGRAACVPDDSCSCLCSTWAHGSEDEDNGDTMHMYQLADGQIVPAESYVPPEPEDPMDVAHEIADEDVTFAEPGPPNGLDTWDDLDVATDDAEADEYVGLAGQPGKNGSDAAGLIGPQGAPSLPSPAPEPEPAPLTDYGPTTGSWEALRDEVLDGA